ncbi:MAG: NUDIX hydrolase [Chloroflexota bacterium]
MNATNIATFLRAIPQSNQDAVHIADLVDNANMDVCVGYVLMLQTIGVVTLTEQGMVKATSQTAKYTLESLASYAERDLRFVDDWKTRGVHRTDEGAFQNGATFLHELETRRLQLLDKPTPSRTEQVAQVLIKRTNPETEQPEFLMQFDENAQQFQLIGGRRSPNDATMQVAIIREIDEEVANSLRFGVDYKLALLIPDMATEPTLSPTFGALTEYHFTIYHMTDLRQPIVLQPEDAWVPIDDVIHGQVQMGDEIVTATDDRIYRQMDELIDGGLAGLPDSFRN